MRFFHNLGDDSREIIESEYLEHIKKVKQYDKSRPYFVYGLFGLGDLFYVGKGKGVRPFGHLIKHDSDSIKDQIIRMLYDMDEPPVVFLIKENLNEIEALSLEKELIEKYGRIINNTGTLANILPGYVVERDEARAKAGGLIHNIRGTRGGIFTKEWRDKNPEIVKEITSRAGKISWEYVSENMKEEHKEWSKRGGLTCGKTPFWTNGKETVRSHECPGEGWRRGHGTVNENSLKNFKLPSWTNGKINRRSETKPADGFFNGVTHFNYKKDPTKIKIIVYTNQQDHDNIPSCYTYGANFIDKEED